MRHPAVGNMVRATHGWQQWTLKAFATNCRYIRGLCIRMQTRFPASSCSRLPGAVSRKVSTIQGAVTDDAYQWSSLAVRCSAALGSGARNRIVSALPQVVSSWIRVRRTVRCRRGPKPAISGPTCVEIRRILPLRSSVDFHPRIDSANSTYTPCTGRAPEQQRS